MKIFFPLILILLSFNGFSQQRGDRSGQNQLERPQRAEKKRTILDDSTKIIYGMNTTMYMLKKIYLITIHYFKN